jgi:hypothetical protein
MKTGELIDMPPEEESSTPVLNFCVKCGAYVGEAYTGFTWDRFSDRGALWCDRCCSGQPPADEKRAS